MNKIRYTVEWGVNGRKFDIRVASVELLFELGRWPLTEIPVDIYNRLTKRNFEDLGFTSQDPEEVKNAVNGPLDIVLKKIFISEIKIS